MARFGAKRFQEFAPMNSSLPTVKLHRISLALEIMAYRRWNFRAIDVALGLLISELLD